MITLEVPAWVLFFLPLMAVAALVVIYWIGMLVSRQHLNGMVDRRDDTIFRYRMAIKNLDVWCGHLHPAIHLIAEHLEAVGSGASLNAGTPVGNEPCDIQGHRTQLIRLLNKESA